jgi:hypothetical protein
LPVRAVALQTDEAFTVEHFTDGRLQSRPVTTQLFDGVSHHQHSLERVAAVMLVQDGAQFERVGLAA